VFDITDVSFPPPGEGRSSCLFIFLRELPPGGGLAQWLLPVASPAILTLGLSGSNPNPAFSHPATASSLPQLGLFFIPASVRPAGSLMGSDTISKYFFPMESITYRAPHPIPAESLAKL
jgi:hypothetical protein